MRKVNRPWGKWQSVTFSLIALIIVVADQLSKMWIRTNLLEGQSLLKIGIFQVTRVHNTGAAFGLFRDHTFVLTIVAIIGITVILACFFLIAWRLPWLNNMPVTVGLGLALGGTVGNLIDRLRLGYVTDFIDFGFWPAFNVADSAVTIGVILFSGFLLFSTQTEKRQDG